MKEGETVAGGGSVDEEAGASDGSLEGEENVVIGGSVSEGGESVVLGDSENGG